LPAGDEPYEGRQVFLDFSGKSCHLFDRLSGQRLETQQQERSAKNEKRQIVSA
jgi:hypothetical protein